MLLLVSQHQLTCHQDVLQASELDLLLSLRELVALVATEIMDLPPAAVDLPDHQDKATLGLNTQDSLATPALTLPSQLAADHSNLAHHSLPETSLANSLQAVTSSLDLFPLGLTSEDPSQREKDQQGLSLAASPQVVLLSHLVPKALAPLA